MIQSLEADNKALSDKIAEITNQNTLFIQENSRLNSLLTEIASIISKISSDLTQVESILDISLNNLNQIITRIGNLSESIAANALTTEEINAQLDILEELLEKVEQDLEDHMTHTSGGSHTSGGN
jgi:DNA repair exonuclease SbcCD ATPase subunit